jgi:hypothetical protein
LAGCCGGCRSVRDNDRSLGRVAGEHPALGHNARPGRNASTRIDREDGIYWVDRIDRNSAPWKTSPSTSRATTSRATPTTSRAASASTGIDWNPSAWVDRSSDNLAQGPAGQQQADEKCARVGARKQRGPTLADRGHMHGVEGQTRRKHHCYKEGLSEHLRRGGASSTRINPSTSSGQGKFSATSGAPSPCQKVEQLDPGR